MALTIAELRYKRLSLSLPPLTEEEAEGIVMDVDVDEYEDEEKGWVFFLKALG